MIRIPAIDLINGSCVRLTKGEFDNSVFYSTDPVEVAQRYEDAGAKSIHIVDLDAARRLGTNLGVIHQILRQTNLSVQTGGGIDSADAIEELLEMGADSVIIGSMAIKERKVVKRWINDFGSERIIIGADVRNKKIAFDGWLSTSEENVVGFIHDYVMAGASTFLCTDIQKDGMLCGPALDLYRNLLAFFPDLDLIASGGVSSMEDLDALESLGLHACVIGKALFENRIAVENLFPKSKSS